jgi:hypothetical protein
LRVLLGELDPRDVIRLGKEATERRNFCPILSNRAGDGIGSPRCWVMNATTCPLDWKIGTTALR